MPERKHLRGASPKEQRQYEHILESAKEEGRYGKRAKEVAARTVMKQHGAEGHEPHRTGRKRATGRASTSRAPSTGRKTTRGRATSRRTGTRTRRTARSRS
jgi:hypothetical protein